MNTEQDERAELIERRARIMGTTIGAHVACSRDSVVDAENAIERCFAWLREVDRRLTRFDAGSDLCVLNASAGQWADASPMLFTVVEQSILAAGTSDGLFDPTILPLLESLGYDRDFALLDDVAHVDISPATQARTWQRGAWRGVEMDRAAQRIRLPAGARLDLGGIAKGWAADVGVEQFFAPFPGVLLDVGGDMRARGHGADGEPWAVGVADPRARVSETDRHSVVIAMAGGGVACSGATQSWWRRRGERRHHLLDPRTGKPARLWITPDDDGPEAESLVASVTAFAPTAAHAEVAAKVALLRGYPLALRAVEAVWDASPGSLATPYTDTGVALLLVMGSGKVICSENLREWLATWGGGGDVWLE